MFNLFKRNKKSTDYKFELPKDTISFSCSHVIDAGKEILYVSHDEEGDWQFMCGDSDHETETGKLICLEHITELDSSVNELYNLPIGYVAERKNKKDKWEIYN